MTRPVCGCTVDGEDAIVYCPLHAAAGELAAHGATLAQEIEAVLSGELGSDWADSNAFLFERLYWFKAALRKAGIE